MAPRGRRWERDAVRRHRVPKLGIVNQMGDTHWITGVSWGQRLGKDPGGRVRCQLCPHS